MEKYARSLTYPANETLVKKASTLSHIGLRPHFDWIPETTGIRRDRLQAFLVAEPTNQQPRDIISRSTVFIPGSQYFPELFIQYWRIYHAHLSKKVFPCEKDETCSDCSIKRTCPQFFWDFQFEVFQKHYADLIAHRDTNITPDDLTRLWFQSIPTPEIESLPDKFELAISHFQNGDLVLFMPGIVHWVMLPVKGDNRIFFKSFIELYGYSAAIIDETGFAVSDGKFKIIARAFEASKIREGQPVPQIQNLQFIFPEDVEEIIEDLYELGVVVVSIYPENDPTLSNDISSYMEFLLEFPEDTHLTDPRTHTGPSNLEPRHLYRNPGNTRSSIFPKNHGNTGLGAYSETAHILKEKLSPFLSKIMQGIYGSAGEITDIGYGIQGPAKE